MPVVVDAKTLTVESFEEAPEFVRTETDTWSAGTYKRKLTVFGMVRVWRMTCTENSVTWVNSAAKAFQDKAKTGATVNMTITDPPPHDLNLNVYIIGVEVEYEQGVPSYRRFILTLQEAPA